MTVGTVVAGGRPRTQPDEPTEDRGHARPAPVAVNHLGRDAHIDAMRAFAVMLAVAAHAGLSGVVPGGSGVTIFFTISGFVITRLLLREYRRTGAFRAREFYRRRLLKIGPPLVVLILLPTAIYAAISPVDSSSIAGQTFFFYNWDKAGGGGDAVLPGSQVVWSLAIEEQFYLLVAIAWLLAIRSRHVIGLAVTIALVVVAWSTITRIAIASGLGPDLITPEGGSNARIYFGSDARADAIALGLLAAVFYDRWQRAPDALRRTRAIVSGHWALPVALALFLVSLGVRDPWFRDTFRYSLQAASTAIVILYGFNMAGAADGPVRALFRRITTPGPIQYVGLASYSVFLVHHEVGLGFRELFPGVTGAVGVVALMAVGLSAGLLGYRLVEVPIMRRGRRG